MAACNISEVFGDTDCEEDFNGFSAEKIAEAQALNNRRVNQADDNLSVEEYSSESESSEEDADQFVDQAAVHQPRPVGADPGGGVSCSQPSK